jgi:glycosyltransferase involved in cell wall biosynthesis
MNVPTTASILIANYNYGRYLPHAIDSALAQTWPNVQVVVVDDGSTDESTLIMQSYGDEIQTLYKENGGQASAINAGFPLVTGETVILLDSDDVLDPTAVEKTIGFFADPDVVKVCWPFEIIDQHGNPTGERKFTHLPQGSFRERALKWGPASHFTPAQSGNFWRKSFLDEVLPIPAAAFRHNADAFLFTFAPFFGTFVSMKEPLTCYRVHGRNLSKRLVASVRLADWETRASLLQHFLADRGESVSIDRWRKNNLYYRRLEGILRGLAQISSVLSKDTPIALVAGPLYGRSDIRPARPVYRAPDDLRSPERNEDDFREFLATLSEAELDHVVIQGRATWSGTNISTLASLLHAEHEVLHESDWILIAKIRRASLQTS